MPRILHISCDYRDGIDQNKTAAVFNLVSNASSFEHTVFSLNRTPVPGLAGRIHSDGDLHSMYWFGLPFGLGLTACLAHASRRLLRYARTLDAPPDLIHCHKLTYEGLIGRRLARALGLPLVCTFRGDTDFKLIRFKRFSRGAFRSVLADSAAVFFLAPWAKSALERMWPDVLPDRRPLLPNIVDLSPASAGQPAADSSAFVTVCHLKDYRRKNIELLLRAFDACVEEGLGMTLDIIGGGSDEQARRLERSIRTLRHPDHVHWLGHKSREEITDRLSGYAALLLPSRRETFGMVYLEALHAGLPFMHSEEAGVDGYFDGAGVAVAVDPRSVDSIRAGILRLADAQGAMKSSVRELTQSGGLERFGREHIVRSYEQTLADVLVAHREYR